MTLLVILCPSLYLLCLQAVIDLESNFQTYPTVPFWTLPFKINLLKVEVESTSCARAPARAPERVERLSERVPERVQERVHKWTNPIFFHFLWLQRQRIIFKRDLLAPWHCLSYCALAYIYYVYKQSLILKAIFKPTLLYPSEPCHLKSICWKLKLKVLHAHALQHALQSAWSVFRSIFLFLQRQAMIIGSLVTSDWKKLAPWHCLSFWVLRSTMLSSRSYWSY